ncbi:hypothetical protein oki286_04560 [Helicobacter pylori]
MRLDYALFNQHLVNSREKAKALVLKNQVLVNKMVVSKPSFMVKESDKIELIATNLFVSRAKDEFDGILETTNRWSRAFLLAFEKLDYLAVQEAKLELDAYSLGKIVFNFAYQVPLPQF